MSNSICLSQINRQTIQQKEMCELVYRRKEVELLTALIAELIKDDSPYSLAKEILDSIQLISFGLYTEIKERFDCENQEIIEQSSNVDLFNFVMFIISIIQEKIKAHEAAISHISGENNVGE